MKYSIFAFFFVLAIAAAKAETQQVTLSPQEYNAIISELISRDPVVKMLLSKQEAASAMARDAIKDKMPPDKVTKP